MHLTYTVTDAVIRSVQKTGFIELHRQVIPVKPHIFTFSDGGDLFTEHAPRREGQQRRPVAMSEVRSVLSDYPCPAPARNRGSRSGCGVHLPGLRQGSAEGTRPAGSHGQQA